MGTKWETQELDRLRASVARAIRKTDTALQRLESADLESPSMKAYFSALDAEEARQKEHQAERDALLLLICEKVSQRPACGTGGRTA